MKPWQPNGQNYINNQRRKEDSRKNTNYNGLNKIKKEILMEQFLF
jgi:hypothetical protein